MNKSIFFLLLFLISIEGICQIQPFNKSVLSIEQIMQDPERWMGKLPDNLIWSDDSKVVYFDWNPEKDTLSSIHSYSVVSKNILKLTVDEKRKLPSGEGEYNRNYSAKIFIRNGNLFLIDVKNGAERQLTDWIGRASQVRFTADQQSVSFVFNQNLYLLKLESGLIKQVTNFVSGDKKKEKKASEQNEWLEKQQMYLFDVLKSKDERQKTLERMTRLEKELQPEPIYIGSARLRSMTLSPSGKFVVYSTSENISGEKETEILNFVTKSGYSEPENSRTKVGSQQAAVMLNILNLTTNKSYPAKTASIPGIRDIPAYKSDYPKAKTEKPADRKINMLGPFWNPMEDMAVVVARSHDSKDRWIMQLDLETGEPKLLDLQH